MKFIFFIVAFVFIDGNGELVVKVKNKGDEVVTEVIEADPEQETLFFSFTSADGTIVKQLLDYKNRLQIFHLTYLPEAILNETSVKYMCFISSFHKQDIISPDAISKLRQKNSNAIRQVEKVLETEVYEMNVKLSKDHLSFTSILPQKYCSHAQHIYALEKDLKFLLSDAKSKKHHKKLVAPPHLPFCSTLTVPDPCICRVKKCIGWLPCGLKFCKGKDFSKQTITFRCGIRTCERCQHFVFLEHFSICPSSSTQAHFKRNQAMTLDAGFS